jgi:glycopeptide antibiotics resistance protein
MKISFMLYTIITTLAIMLPQILIASASVQFEECKLLH